MTDMKLFIKKNIIFAFLFSLLPVSLFCFEPVETSQLLISYLENDNDLKNVSIDAQKAELSYSSTKIANGFEITLSTGNILIRTDSDGTNFSIKPSVQMSLPQASNLSVNLSSNISSQTQMEDSKINASVDILGSNNLNRKITLLKAERSLIESKRKLQQQALKSEKNFYTELKTLLNSTNSIINLQKTLYTNKMDFEKIKAQGYSQTSSTYRLAQNKVISTEHDIENATRSLIHAYVIFYKKCGYDISLDNSINFYELIPNDISEVSPIDATAFNQDLYSEIESAIWSHKINSMQRKAKANFSLSANGGVTLNNSNTKSTTIDAGISAGYQGVTVGAGVNVPVDSNPYPAVTLSATVSPNTFRQNAITNRSDELDEQKELLAIENARSNYATQLVDLQQNLEDLQWSQKTDSDSFEMYDKLEKDLSKWYKDGFITESEYLSAKVNVQFYTVKQIINKIDLIIYNDNVSTMFVDEISEN